MKTVMLLAGIWAAFRPAVYGFLFTIASDPSAIVDFLVVGSCILLVRGAFKTSPRLILTVALIVLLTATSIGFLYYFQDSGASGPLPYEWLNGYYVFSSPLIALAIILFFVKPRLVTSNHTANENPPPDQEGQ